MKILSDEKILEISQITRENIEAGEDGYLTTRCNVAKAQHKDTLRQVGELLDGIENPWDSPHSRAFPHGPQGNRKYGYNEAIQTIKALLEE